MKRYAAWLAAAVLLLWLVASPVLAFPDVPVNHPYGEAIEDLSDREIIVGRQDGSFGPGDPVWRCQFAKMISGVFALAPAEGDRPAPFSDLGPNDKSNLYPHEYVAAAYYAGLTKGRTATTFAPYAYIARAQVITMLLRGLERRYPGLLEDPPATFAGTWGDFSALHADYARKAEWNGLLAGLGRTSSTGEAELARLDPWGKMSRGEVAQILSNVLALLDDAVVLQDADLLSVVDGDTVEVLYRGRPETVQLYGIRAAATEPLARQARGALQQWLSGRDIGLELEARERDSRGHLLAYVWYQDGADYSMANWDLLGLGLAEVDPLATNTLYGEDFEQAEEYARLLGLGLH
jgi:endonuclease YncB( thermonuclease family)